MSVHPVVRRATADDMGQILDIDDVSRVGMDSQRGGRAWIANHSSLRSDTSSNPHERCFVGVIDDVVVGFAMWDIDDVPGFGRVIRVERVHVLAEARELGFGDALLASVVDEGRNRACDHVEGEALPGDRETKNLYERAGITARSIIVSKRLSD
ncbi:MAG: GNAT family N-acetyltransferase [Actinobacteria bacterium]|nr:GNAT family N-acetyltransferase [Actinomycetota bacterium]